MMAVNRFSSTAQRVIMFSCLSFALDYSFQLVDIFWVAQLGVGAATAIAISSAILFVVLSVNEIVGVGSVALFSQAYGRGNLDRLGKVVFQTFALKFCLGLLAVAAFLGFAAFVRHMGLLSPVEQTYFDSYSWLIWPVALLLPLSSTAMTTLRTIGNPGVPTLISLTALMINLVCNPLLIFGFGPVPALGIAGAASATLVAESFSLLAGMTMLLRNRQGIRIFRWRNVTWSPDLYHPLLTIGLPIAGVMVLYNIEQSVLAGLIATLPSTVSDGYGIGARIFGLLFMVNFGVSVGVSVACGQAIGRNRVEEVLAGIGRICAIVATALVLVGLCLLAFAPMLVGAFTDNAESITVAVTYLRFMAFANLGLGLIAIFQGVFEGAGRNGPPLHSAIVMYLGFEFPALVIIYLWAEMSGEPITPETIWLAVIAATWLGAMLMLRAFLLGKWMSGTIRGRR